MQLPSVDNLKLYVDADSGSSANDYSTGTWYDLSGDTANNGTRYSANFQARNPNNVWHCIVGTYNGTTKTRTIYLDGAQIATNTVADLDWTNTTNKFQIGNSPGESYYFNGQIAVGMAWAATLSADEVLQAYNYFKHRYIKE